MLSTSERDYLFESMKGLLDEYDYDYSNNALLDIIDEWFIRKGGLIEAFKKHPNYLEGKFMIAFDADYERTIDKKASRIFSNWVTDVAMPKLRNTYPEAVKGDYYCGLSYSPFAFFGYLADFAERVVSEDSADKINQIFTDLKIHRGQKTSRVVNKICQYLGFDKVDGYNREFAKYADSLSPMVIKRHTILSINPLDYLTMSFGNSWASCHTIDKENYRGLPNSYSGCYSSGTISYMLDEVSMVLYTVDASYDGNEYWHEDKINRQMFHYGNEKLIQGRLYPQDNDGDGDAYTPYRNIVQQIISTIFDFPNLWTLGKGTDAVCYYARSGGGTNYPDYKHFNNCTISRIKGSENPYAISIGEEPICIECGERHKVEDNISCCHSGYVCADCGCRIYDEDDVIYVDDEPYCRECVDYCECCGEYHRQESTYINGYGYVCEDCRNERFYYCEECGEWMHEDDAHWIECEERYVCQDCIDNYYARCEDCGEYYRTEDMHECEDGWLCEDCYDERKEMEDDEDEEADC